MNFELFFLFMALIGCANGQNIASQHHELCPSSGSLLSPNDHSGNFMYPISFYGNFSEDLSLHVKTTNCFAIDSVPLNVTLHQCPTNHTICPIIPENLHDAVSEMNGRQTNADFCHLQNSLHDSKEVVRLFVFGGSVTAGRATEGCCSKPECTGYRIPRCAWAQYFGNWMNNTFAAEVKTYNLAQAGWTTSVMAEELIEKLKSVGVSTLNSNDLMFVDHSVNDNSLDEPMVFSVSVGLETLIRRIYSVSAVDSWPTIVVVAVDPSYKKYVHKESLHYYQNYEKVLSYCCIKPNIHSKTSEF